MCLERKGLWEFGFMLMYTRLCSVPLLCSVEHEFNECVKKKKMTTKTQSLNHYANNKMNDIFKNSLSTVSPLD